MVTTRSRRVAADRLDAGVAVVEREGHAALRLTVGATSFTVLPEVGLLGVSLRVGDREYLALPGGADAALAGHTTGLPLLAPWANRLSDVWRLGRRTVDLRGRDLHRDDSGLALHGTMIGRAGWELDSVRTGTDRASARFRFDAARCAAVMASFPFAHELVVEFTVTEARVTVATTIAATGDRAVPVSFGWHPYFVLPGATRDRMRLELPRRHRLVVDERRLPTGAEIAEPAGTVRLAGRGFDDGYRLGANRRLVLAAGRRRLELALDRNYDHVQVYTPPGADSIALEPMTAATDALARNATPVIAPGERFTARFALTLS